MELENIDSLNLYIDKEFIHDETINTKRVPLDRDLDIGETAYFRDECKNKIVKHDDDEYIFYRFDGIQTHIENYDSEYSIEDFREEVTSQLDYEKLNYSLERVELIDRLLRENLGIYDLLSSNRVIMKEQKTRRSFLSEDQRLDKQLENLASYILHPKYRDENEEEYIEELKEWYNTLKKKRGKTEQEFKEMFDVKDEIDLFNQGVITRSREQRNKLRESIGNDFDNIENQNVIVDSSEFSKEKATVEYLGRDLEIDANYWSRMGFSEDQASFRSDVINSYEAAIDILSKQLGIGQGSTIRTQKERELLKKFEPIVFENEWGKKSVISPSQRVNGIKKMYNELKSDFYVTKEILTSPVEFAQITPSKTKIDYNNDTWYEKEDGRIVELSKNTILFSNPNTYKGLITNYYNLKDKYYDNFMDDMWYILIAFEELVEKTVLSNKEKFVLDRVMKDYYRQEIVEEYEREFGKTVSPRVLSSWINRVIPNKIRETFLNSVTEWLYTYKVKGEFKQCSKCNEIKTINSDRFFRKRSDNKGDGFYNSCRKCE